MTLYKKKNFKQLKQKFKRDHGTSFTTEVKKFFQKERKQINKGDIIRTSKENIEQHWKETAVEPLVLID